MHNLAITLKKLGYERNANNCPVSEEIAEYGFYLPSGLGITEEEILHVSDVLKGVLND